MERRVFSLENFRMTKKEKCITVLGIIMFVVLSAGMFYGTVVAGIILAPCGIFIYKTVKEKLYKKRVKEIESQFKDLLVCVSDLMQTGYSIENAFMESYKEIEQLYGKESVMCQELLLVTKRLKLHMSIEEIIKEWSLKYEIDSMKTFYETFTIAKRTGGSMSKIIRNVCDVIVLRQQVKDEIDVAINGKKMEHRVMMVIPLGILMYVSFASPGFLDVMYETILGNLIMTVCFVLYIVGYKWGEKIIEVEV